jgi:(S)-2-hydroxy-acid oxidase
MDTAFTLSTFSTSTIEEVAEGSPHTLRFFQMYIYRDRDITLQLIRRAEKCGYKALFLTVDQPFFGKKLAINRNNLTVPSHLK